jgi:hypothetical protein
VNPRNALAVAAIVVAFTMTACDSSSSDHAQPASSTWPSTTRCPALPVSEHRIADLDGDGVNDTVRIDDPSKVAPKIGLRLSGGRTCSLLRAPFDPSSSVDNVLGANDFDRSGRLRLWVEIANNGGKVIAIADRVGCRLRFLDRAAGGRFDAYIVVYGHVCCPDTTAAVSCVPREGYVEIVTTEVGPTLASVRAGDFSHLATRPYNWTRERLRVENDRVVTVSSTHGSVPNRDRVPAEMLAGGLHCAGVNAA